MEKERKNLLKTTMIAIMLLFSMLVITVPTTLAVGAVDVEVGPFESGEDFWINVSGDDGYDVDIWLAIEEDIFGPPFTFELLDTWSIDSDGWVNDTLEVPWRYCDGTYWVNVTNSSDDSDYNVTQSIDIVNTPTIDWQEEHDVTCGDEVGINISGWKPNAIIHFYFEDFDTGEYEKIGQDRIGDEGWLNTTITIPQRGNTSDYYVSTFDWYIVDPNDNETCADYNVSTGLEFDIEYIYTVTVDPETVIWDEDYQSAMVYVYDTSGQIEDTEVRVLMEGYWTGCTAFDPNVNRTFSDGDVMIETWFNYTDPGIPYINREINYTIWIVDPDDQTYLLGFVELPLRLDMQDVTPLTATYLQEEEVSGYIYDANGNPVNKYPVAMADPDGYVMFYGNTSASGNFEFDVTFESAGTWYIGTYEVDDGCRPDYPDFDPGFIPYEEIIVSSGEATITVDPDTTTHGFNRTFEIYCEYDGDPVPDGTYVYVTGLDLIYDDIEYDDDDDPVELEDTTVDGWVNISNNGTTAHLKFLQSGKATFLCFYDQDWQYYEDNEDEAPLISGETDIDVTAPDAINVFVEYVGEDKVLLADMDDNDIADPPVTDMDWGYYYSHLYVDVYGRNESTRIDANITVTGCGVDEEFEGEEQGEQMVGYDGYVFDISPRTGGILTITVYNDTEDFETSEDIEISGLQSEVTTSVGDDKYITVETEETLTIKVEEIDGTDLTRAEVHVVKYDPNWDYVDTANATVGDFTEGNGLLGEYTFMPDVDDYLSDLGYLVISVKMGYLLDTENVYYYTYDIVEVEPNHDLVITIIEPDVANRTLTAGLEYDLEVEITNLSGNDIPASIMGDYNGEYEVIGEIVDDEMEVISEVFEFERESSSSNVWYLDDFIPPVVGTLLISAWADEGRHHGNNSEIDVECAEITYVPSGLTCGIFLEDQEVEVFAVDALGNVISDENLQMVKENASGTVVETNTVELDDDGMGTLEISVVGRRPGKINATLNGAWTCGELIIDFPVFTIEPGIAYVGIVNDLLITARNLTGDLLEGINISFTPSVNGTVGVKPDPVETDENGQVELSIEPDASGTLNVTLCYDIEYDTDGRLVWEEILTPSTIEVTSKKPLTLTVSQSPVFEGDTLTVTVKTDGTPVADVDVQFGQETKATGSDGKTTFTVPNPGVESAVYIIEASKFGYISDSLSITVIKVWQISIIGPSEAPSPGEEFTITIIAKGSPLAGATATFDGKTYTSGGDGKMKLIAPEVDEETEFTIIATFDPYMDGTLVITIAPGGIPGFELVALLAALGVALILLRRRR